MVRASLGNVGGWCGKLPGLLPMPCLEYRPNGLASVRNHKLSSQLEPHTRLEACFVADQASRSALDSCPWGPMGASWHCDVCARPGTRDLELEMGLQCGLGGGANKARAGIQSAELLEAEGWRPNLCCPEL